MTTTTQTSAEADVVSADTSTTLKQACPTPVLIAEQEVVFCTEAAAPARPAITHRHWTGSTWFAAIRHIHIALPEPRPIYPRREATYLDTARMSRLMGHL